MGNKKNDVYCSDELSPELHKKNAQKVKLVRLLEILKQETDEDHPRTTFQFCEDLLELGITCDRRTLKKDMDTLSDNGYDICHTFVGHEKAYYYKDRSLSNPEIKILMDAVRAATFITEKESSELIQMLAEMAGSHKAIILQESMTCSNTKKHSNEEVLYSIDCLQEAISRRKRVTFYYFSLDLDGNRQFHHDHALYIVDPLALILDHENYYLMGYSLNKNELRNYRIDRMVDVRLMRDEEGRRVSICPDAEAALSYISTYREQVFSMFMGKAERVTLEFQNSLKMLGVVYDRFGENIRIEKTVRDTLTVTVDVQISPAFFGWLFQFSDQMKVLSPDKVVEEYEYRAALVCGIEPRVLRRLKAEK